MDVLSYSRFELLAAIDDPLKRALVKYALAGMNSRLFVSKYQLALPNEEEIRAFIEGRLSEETPALISSKELRMRAHPRAPGTKRNSK